MTSPTFSAAHLLGRLRASLNRRYDVLEEIGRGGMAVVFRARDMQHERDVAIKVLRPDVATAVGAERFLREVKFAARLQHPNILPLYDSGSTADLLYFVMPFVAGETLRQRLDREGQLAIDEAVAIAREVAEALGYAHSHDIVHRDVKPENIMLANGHALVADFGISRAISGSGEVRLTEAGVSPGTPAYMSPEQPGGRAPVDGRSDIYSLGCVLYEMLAGEPPFTGPTAQAIMARHLSDAPRSLRVVRSSVSPGLEGVIECSLNKVPADRFATALSFAEALDAPADWAAPSKRARSLRRWWPVIPAAAVVAALVLGVKIPFGGGLKVDDSLHVILPFRVLPGQESSLLTGDECQALLYGTFNHWRDLAVIGRIETGDAVTRLGSGSMTMAAGLDIAGGFRAGRLVWGEVWQQSDTTYVRAVLYDVGRGGRPLSDYTIALTARGTDLGARFADLASRLLVTPGTNLSATDLLGTVSFGAWREYEAGQSDLRTWNLAGAASHFRAATRLDPEFAAANLWLAQAAVWSGLPEPEWRAAASRAVVGANRLAPRDADHAAGLLALAEDRYQQACTRYRDILARDSLDFRAWMGIGACNSRDRIVVPDSASPSGWRFRGSYHTAIQAYRRALQIVPSFPFAYPGSAYDELARLLFAERVRIRTGFAPGADTSWFASYPALVADTIAFTPYPLPDVLGLAPPGSSPTFPQAVERNQRVLLAVMRSWARSFPDSVAALEGLARALEASGLVNNSADVMRSALAAVERARRLDRDGNSELSLITLQVRLLAKNGQFPAAAALADSALESSPNPGAEASAALANLAALTGRIDLAASLAARAAIIDTLRLPDGRPLIVPFRIHREAARLYVYASFGVPRDSIRAIEQRLEKDMTALVRPGLRDDVRAAVLVRPSLLAFATMGPGYGHRTPRWSNPFIELQSSLARHDTLAVRGRLDSLDVLRAPFSSSLVSFDGVLREAGFRLAVGDSARAVQQLDGSLTGLVGQSRYLTEELSQAAALAQVMALRAELAERLDEPETASRWAAAAVALWHGADDVLQPRASHLRRLALGGG